MKLLQSQKNQVYESIELVGLSPTMFVFRDPIVSSSPTILDVKKSTYYFRFHENNVGTHYAIYSPGSEMFEESKNPGSWFLQLENVRAWLRYLKRELNSPDKWKQLQEQIENADFGTIEYEDSKFTIPEYELLVIKIDELKLGISRLDLIEEQVNQINAKLDHLQELAKTMNKSDWKDLFIGTFISLTIQLSVDKSTGHLIFELLKTFFTKILLIS